MPKNETSCTLNIRGMDCAEEVSILKREIGPLVGGEQHLTFDILNGQMTVLPGAQTADSDGIIRAIQKTGMTASLVIPSHAADSETERRSWWDKHGRLALTTASGLLTARLSQFTMPWREAGRR